MKVGILGGSFNPAHLGHIHLSEIAIKKLALNQLWWIPTSQNPLKAKNDFLSFEERVKNCQILTRKNPKIYVKKIDNFYTIDLINYLQNKHKNYEFIWVMGADNLAELHRWHDFKNLIQKIEFAIFSRDNYLKKANNFKASKLYQKYKNKSKKLPKFSIFHSRKLNISSTQIRNNNNA